MRLGRYDAFISYSHGEDGLLAAALQEGLERFASSWRQPRMLRIFRDTTDLSAAGLLFASIAGALEASDWFVLIASPQSAASLWVGREVRWWLANKRPGNMLIALSDGTITWGGRDFSWPGTDALPAVLSGVFAEEPLWADFREIRRRLTGEGSQADGLKLLRGWRRRRLPSDWVADIAAPIRGVPKDSLVGTHLRYRRRLRRTVRAVLALLVALAAAASAASVLALMARRQAAELNSAALSRRLASESQALDTANPATASLLAAAAWQIAPTPQARDSLLNVLTQPARGVLPGGGGAAIAFSPNGTMLATVDVRGVMRLWNVATRRQLGAPLNGQCLDVNAIAFSPDGKTLASSGASGVAQLWQLATHRQIGSPLEAGSPSSACAPGAHVGSQGVNKNSVAFSPNGEVLATVGADGAARLWKTATHHQIGAPLPGRGRIDAVAFSPDGKILATAAVNGTTQLWDAATRSRIGAPLDAGGYATSAVAFSPNGKLLATASIYGITLLWSVATHQQVGGPIPASQEAYGGASIAFSPDGTILAIASAQGPARLRDLATWGLLGQSIGAGAGGVQAMAFSPDGTTLVTSCADGTARLWNLATRIPLGAPLRVGAGPVGAIAFSPDGETFATGGHDGAARLWDLRTRTQITKLVAGTPDVIGVDAVTFSPDGKILVTAGGGRAFPMRNVKGGIATYHDIVRFWDLASHSQIGRPLTIEPGPGVTLAFSPDGKILATASYGVIRLWNASAHELVARIRVAGADNNPGTSNALAFSPDGSILAVANGRTVSLWDAANLTQIGTLANDSENMAGVAFSPDGKTLATWGNPGPLSLWNAISRTRIGAVLAFGTSEVYSAVFSSDGKTLVTANLDGTIRRWDITTHASIGAPLTIGPPINGVPSDAGASIAIAPGGRVLASVDFPTPVQLWDIALPNDPLKAACAIAGRSMTRQEWRIYIQSAPFQRVC